MRQVGYFWTALPFASKLQYLAFGLVLGALFYQRDLNPANRAFGQPLWHVTGVVIVLMILLGRLLLPVMLAVPDRTRWVLSGLGLGLFAMSLYLATRRLILLTHLAMTAALWLDASCWFWFISESQRRAALLAAHALDNDSDLDDSDSGDAGLADPDDVGDETQGKRR